MGFVVSSARSLTLSKPSIFDPGFFNMVAPAMPFTSTNVYPTYGNHTT